MAKSALGGFTNATDVADYLVKKGLPFRDAYKSVGIEVNEGRFSYQGAPGKTNGELTPADLKHTSLGSLGNLCTEKIRTKMESAASF